MLRLIVVAQEARGERDMVRRAESALAGLGGSAAEVVVSPRGDGRGAAARLDAAVFTRPLPDRVVVVGRDPSCSPAEIAFLDTVLDLRPELSAATVAACPGADLAPLLVLGGVFRGGPLCQAGGFTGDGRRSVADRIEALGFASAVLPDPTQRRIDHPTPHLRRVPA